MRAGEGGSTSCPRFARCRAGARDCSAGGGLRAPRPSRGPPPLQGAACTPPSPAGPTPGPHPACTWYGSETENTSERVGWHTFHQEAQSLEHAAGKGRGEALEVLPLLELSPGRRAPRTPRRGPRATAPTADPARRKGPPRETSVPVPSQAAERHLSQGGGGGRSGSPGGNWGRGCGRSAVVLGCFPRSEPGLGFRPPGNPLLM